MRLATWITVGLLSSSLQAAEAAKGGDGRMLFGVEREGKASDVTIQLKAMRPDIEARVTGRDQVQMQDVLKKVDACIADYEAKYGKVEAEGGRG